MTSSHQSSNHPTKDIARSLFKEAAKNSEEGNLNKVVENISADTIDSIRNEPSVKYSSIPSTALETSKSMSSTSPRTFNVIPSSSDQDNSKK